MTALPNTMRQTNPTWRGICQTKKKSEQRECAEAFKHSEIWFIEAGPCEFGCLASIKVSVVGNKNQARPSGSGDEFVIHAGVVPDWIASGEIG
jgi:hypothetical protein